MALGEWYVCCFARLSLEMNPIIVDRAKLVANPTAPGLLSPQGLAGQSIRNCGHYSYTPCRHCQHRTLTPGKVIRETTLQLGPSHYPSRPSILRQAYCILGLSDRRRQSDFDGTSGTLPTLGCDLEHTQCKAIKRSNPTIIIIIIYHTGATTNARPRPRKRTRRKDESCSSHSRKQEPCSWSGPRATSDSS